jgi:hypothetical protein
MTEVRIDFKHCNLKKLTRYDGAEITTNGPLVMDIQIGDLKKEVELDGVSNYYVDKPEGFYWSIYEIERNYPELIHLRETMMKNGEYFLNGERMALTNEQISHYKKRKKEDRNGVIISLAIAFGSMIGMAYLGIKFWDISKWILLVFTAISVLGALKQKNLKIVIISPLRILSSFLMFPSTVLASAGLFVFCWLSSGEFKSGFRGLIEVHRKDK